MSRNKARLVAMQSLFQLDDAPDSISELAGSRAGEENLDERDLQYLETIISSVSAHKETIDKYINDYSIDWDIGRLGKVERAVLRLAVCEMLYVDDVPTSVAINEAVLLAKKYGADQAAKFINGILGKFSREALGKDGLLP
jgi:transcription antitermination protein NusB